MISFIHVGKKYEKSWRALQDVHFRLDRGEFVFLTGPSGAGKTTILKLVYMDEIPDEGEVLISFNKDLAYRSSEASPSRIQLLRRRLGIPAVIVSHDPEDVKALADEVFVLDGGGLRQRLRADDPGLAAALEQAP